MELKRAISDHSGALIAGVVVAVVVAAVLWLVVLTGEELPEGLLQTNGRIEGDRLTVASVVPGRVAAVEVEAGATVDAGEILIRLDDARVRARLRQAEQAVATAEASVAAAERGLQLLRRQVPLSVSAAQAAVAEAQAGRDAAEAAARQARRDADRFTALADRGSVPSRRAEQARTAEETARSQRDAAQSTLERARSRLEEARLGQQQIAARQAEVEAVRGRLRRAQAAADEARAALNDLEVRAPAAGTVVERLVDPGESVAAGSPLIDVVNLDALYLKAYVPEVHIGTLRRDLPARIWTDAFPDTPFDATVRYIASEAEFTPKEVQTPEQRVKMVYEVRLHLTSNPDHTLTPGMPADAVVRWLDDVQWQAPQW